MTKRCLPEREPGIGNPGHQVGGPRACGRNTGRDLPRGTCTATRHKRRALLMPGEYAFYTGLIEAVIYRQDMSAGQTKDKLDTVLLHVFNDQLADRDFHVFTALLISRHCNAFCRDSHNFTDSRHSPRYYIYNCFIYYIAADKL